MIMETPFSVWVIFNLFVLAMLAVDLFVFHRKAHVVRGTEAAVWRALSVAASLLWPQAAETPVLHDPLGGAPPGPHSATRPDPLQERDHG